jgi:hypothetical protein
VNFSARPNAIALPPGDWQLLLSSVSGASLASPWAAHETRIYTRQP